MTAIAEARELYAAAREDHRLAALHRRRARERMAELRAFCDRNGIRFELLSPPVAGDDLRHGRTTPHPRDARA